MAAVSGIGLVGSQEWCAQTLGPSPSAFPGVLAGSWIGSETVSVCLLCLRTSPGSGLLSLLMCALASPGLVRGLTHWDSSPVTRVGEQDGVDELLAVGMKTNVFPVTLRSNVYVLFLTSVKFIN